MFVCMHPCSCMYVARTMAHDGVPSSRSQRRKRVVRKSRSEARGSARSADLCSAVPVGVAASQTEEFGYGFV